MFTIFAIPKPFGDPHIDVIQRNAIISWTHLRPQPEIILFGDEEGTGAICQELGLHHIPEIARNEFGTPLLSDIFAKAQNLAAHDLMCFVNADVILMSDFVHAIERVMDGNGKFLLAGAKRDVLLKELWDFGKPNWEQELRRLVRQHYAGREQEFWQRYKLGAEYFVFPRGFFSAIPPFLVGRWVWDGWLLWKARDQGADVFDATPIVLAVHQLHDHSHIRTTGQRPWFAGEAALNVQLAGLRRVWYLREATHILTPDGPRRLWGQKQLYWCKMMAQALLVYRSGPIRHALGLRRATLRRLKHSIVSLLPHT